LFYAIIKFLGNLFKFKAETIFNRRRLKMAYENISTQNLGELTVLNEQREQVKISTLWREKTAVLVFIRHFG